MECTLLDIRFIIIIIHLYIIITHTWLSDLQARLWSSYICLQLHRNSLEVNDSSFSLKLLVIELLLVVEQEDEEGLNLMSASLACSWQSVVSGNNFFPPTAWSFVVKSMAGLGTRQCLPEQELLSGDSFSVSTDIDSSGVIAVSTMESSGGDSSDRVLWLKVILVDSGVLVLAEVAGRGVIHSRSRALTPDGSTILQ